MSGMVLSEEDQNVVKIIQCDCSHMPVVALDQAEVCFVSTL